MIGAVRWSAEFAELPVAAIGGKAKGLGTLIAAGLPVPAAFCVTVAARRAALAGAGAEVDGEIRRALAGLRAAGADSFAVRSSYLSEDTAGALSPGVYRSEVGLGGDEEVLAAVRRVWGSAGSAAAVDYRRAMGLAGDEDAMAVIVQRAVPALAGGVVYTLPPGGDPATVLIEYAAGAPGNVTDNLVPPLRSVLGKRDRSAPAVPEDGPVSGERLRTLADWAAGLERELDGPLDLEWLLDGAGELFLLQARRLPHPVTAAAPPYVAPAVGTALRSDKLRPFRLRGQVELNTVEADLVLPSAFAAYRATGRVPGECREVFARYAARGPVSVRSVYWSALGSGDMLPQSPLLTSVADFEAHLEHYWRYVLEHGKADYSAEVALLVANWTDLRASVIATAGTDGRIEIGALYGQLEGLESCAHDRYTVAAGPLRTERADVPHKPVAVTEPRRPPRPLPAELRDRRVLDRREVRAVAATTARLAERLGPVRVELLVLNGTGDAAERVVAWQVTELRETAGLRYFRVRPAGAGGAGPEAVASGRLTVLGAPADLGALDGAGERVVAPDFERLDLRDPELVGAVAGALRAAGHPVLLRGSVLSHFAALLREYRVPVYPVNAVPAGLGDGDPVEVLPD
ncbi:PEP/pyruvate-binding domain-containing protein [Kitasatospora sp. NPDC089797]|uniref:PEP/pyruvate-binding domain-containing protein n=1 Tax=Kitasatospora sp. NPDC089797 TaxID=3155298 RepID=UPI00343753C7